MATPGSIQLIQGGGQVVAPGAGFPQPVVFRAYDTLGNPMVNEPMVWGTALSGPSAVFSSTGTRNFNANTDANGYAWSGGFNGGGSNLTANTTPGSWLGAIQFVNALGISNTFSATNQATTPVPTTLTLVSGSGLKAALNAAYGTLTAQVLDQNGDGGPQATVRFSVPAGHGTFAGGVTQVDVVSDSTGFATAPTFTANAVAGAFTVTVSIPASPAVAAITTTWTNVDASLPTTLQLTSGSNQQAAVSTAFGNPLKVRVFNGLGNPLSGITVTFTSPASGASCVFPSLFSVGTSVSDANGYATSSTPSANALTGSYFVTAAATGATGAQFSLTNGQSYQPEVCTAYTAPVGASNQGAGSPWANLNSSFNGSTSGASVTFATGDSTQILLVAPPNPSLFSPIADDAKITKFQFTYDIRAAIGVGSSYSPTVQRGLYDGATKRASGAQQAPGSAFAAQTATFSAPFTGGATISGAQLKAGSFGIGLYVNATAGMGGDVGVRLVKVSICYQNPNLPPATLSVPLQLCEV